MNNYQYNIVSDLRLSRCLTHQEIEDLGSIFSEDDIDDQAFHTFYEMRHHPNYSNYQKINGEDRCTIDHSPRYLFWAYNEINRTIEHDGGPDCFIITTLHYIVKNFLLPRNINIEGKVSCTNIDIKEAYVYNIRNDEFTYNINESIDIIEKLNFVV